VHRPVAACIAVLRGAGNSREKMTVLNRSVNLLLALALLSSDVGLAEQSARYVGRVAVEWVDDSESGQPMKLLDEFSFVDARGTAWIVPGGQIVDGKSLPPAFRSLFGAPFIGRHRRAAVVHDYYAGQRRVAWRSTRRRSRQVSPERMPRPCTWPCTRRAHAGSPRRGRAATTPAMRPPRLWRGGRS
jgi:Protein of unknown function (DUF1353)